MTFADELGFDPVALRTRYDAERDKNLTMLDAAHLFPNSTTYLGVRRDTYLRGFLYDFIGLIAPHLNRAAVNAAFK